MAGYSQLNRGYNEEPGVNWAKIAGYAALGIIGAGALKMGASKLNSTASSAASVARRGGRWMKAKGSSIGNSAKDKMISAGQASRRTADTLWHGPGSANPGAQAVPLGSSPSVLGTKGGSWTSNSMGAGAFGTAGGNPFLSKSTYRQYNQMRHSAKPGWQTHSTMGINSNMSHASWKGDAFGLPRQQLAASTNFREYGMRQFRALGTRPSASLKMSRLGS